MDSLVRYFQCVLNAIDTVCVRGASVATLAVLLITIIMPHPVRAADVIVEFDTPEQAELYYELLKEYRCLKCQNQNLADSHASLADDLRREIREQILEDKVKKDIDDYLVSRYGEFVLYRPTFSSKTWVLWLGPFVLLLIGLWVVYSMAKQRASGRDIQVERQNLSSEAFEQHEDRLRRARDLLREKN